MSYITVRDDAIWARHVEDPELRDRIRSLSQNAPLLLLVEGVPVRFVKMRDGKDGRPTEGLRPADAEAHRFWRAMQERRGERVRIALADPTADNAHLASVSALLSEWESDEDAAAYDGL
jgi:hypothetical protein